jgi:hypothetical protein
LWKINVDIARRGIYNPSQLDRQVYLLNLRSDFADVMAKLDSSSMKQDLQI